MTWKQLQKQAYTLTEKEYQKYVDEILAAYQSAYIQIRDQLKTVYAKFPSMPKTEYYNYMTKSRRLERLMDEITRIYKETSTAAGKSQIKGLSMATANSYYRNLYAMSWSEEVAGIFPILNDKAIEYSVFGTPEKWAELTPAQKELYKGLQHPTILKELLAKDAVTSLDAIKQGITQSLISGDSYSKVGKKIREIMNTTAYKADRIARTEGARCLNAGNYLVSQNLQSKGVDIVRQWDATLDSRTRETHAAADGQKEDKNGLFYVGDASGSYPGNMSSAAESINCRCAVLDIVGDMQPELRRARDPVTGESDIIGWQSFDEWANNNDLVYRNGVWKVKV